MIRKLLRVGTIFLLIGSVVAIVGYVLIFRTNNIQVNSEELWLSIKESISTSQMLQIENLKIQNQLTWQLACRAKRIETIKPGRYRFTTGMSNSDIIRELRSGGKSTIQLRIDDTESLEELAGKLGKYLLNDSAYFMNAFEDGALLQAIGIKKEELAATIRPNTYEFYWNMNGKTFLTRMKSESDALWNSERKNKASSMALSPFEVVVLASIIKAETASEEEAPKIAGLYLNRLRIQMPLQSDPTTLFGRKKSAQRVYLNDLQAESPYNTYLNNGLPPSPINFPETMYIDAVLNAENHDYLFMCAEPGGSGRHTFSRTLSDHEINRRKYIQWLEKKGIR